MYHISQYDFSKMPKNSFNYNLLLCSHLKEAKIDLT